MSRKPQPDPSKVMIECAELLSHVQTLEARLIDRQRSKDEEHFGHPPTPQLHMCKIPDPDNPGADLPVTAVLAITRRCASAQLLKESADFAPVGSPVEVLVMSGEDQVNCATLIGLERGQLSADDAKVVPQHGGGGATRNNQSAAVSLMSGGIVPVAPSPRVAVVIGTTHSRIISIEFSVKANEMTLARRNHNFGDEAFAYFEPLPKHALTEHQKVQQRMPGGGSRDPYTIASGKPNLSRAQMTTAEIAAHQLSLSHKKGKRIVPLVPVGGVTSIKAYTSTANKYARSVASVNSAESRNQKRERTHLWISYGDGTAVRLHHAGFFPSVVQKHFESKDFRHLESILGDSVLRFQIKLPPIVDTEVSMIPLPKYHPSPLAPFPRFRQPEFLDDDEMALGETLVNDKQDDVPDMHEAIVYCKGAMADSFPTIAFYTSEDQDVGLINGGNAGRDGNTSGNTPAASNVIGSVIGGLLGIFGGGNDDNTKNTEEVKDLPREVYRQPPQWDPKVPFASMNYEATPLYAGYEIHDPPRQVTHCTVDPDGDLAAASDTLGRVSLIDLSTKQIIRMWKGYRDTQCHWIQVPQSISNSRTKQKTSTKTKVLYLVIHSRQRKVVEIWRTRHGPKVKTMQVGRDAQILSCRELTPVGYVWSSFLVHSTVPFSNMNQAERIVFKEEDGSMNITQRSGRSSARRHDPIHLSQDAVVKLNRLQQLLGDTNVPCQGIDVYKALEHIRSLKDLATALDFLAVSPALEEKMEVQGSEFQRLAISHCKDKLDDAIKSAGKESLTNPNVQLLAFKISYYTQVISAYDILTKFDIGGVDSGVEGASSKRSTWALETIGWTTTYEQITGKSIDADVLVSSKDALKFHLFTSACVPPKEWMNGPLDGEEGYRVHLSDSSKTRRDVLVYIFKPLLGDVFAFSSVNQVFETLGIKDDYDYISKCFAEWFMVLPLKDLSEKGLCAVSSPMGRWLQDIVFHQLEIKTANGGSDTPLNSILKFCRDSHELIRVFWLASLCREAVAEASKQVEEKTYGKIPSSESVAGWDKLLRQLRVSLLVSLRLFGIRLGALPITVQAVEEDGNFSILQWLAHDELAMSHKQDEIVSLENACRISSHAFDPTSEEGDDPDRFKTLQHSCLAAALSEAERSEFLVDFDDDDRLGALLLYLSPFNIGELLVFHRALLLAAEWGKDPGDLDILKDAISAMKSMDVDNYKAIAAAVRVEIWQTNIRPVYRALLMGFDDVQEISADVVAPLFRDAAWVTSFGKLASDVLVLMTEFAQEDPDSLTQFQSTKLSVADDGATWPPVREDFMLQRLVQRNRPLNNEAVDAHRVLICALLISHDIQSLSKCIPSFYDLFLPGAIFSPVVPLADADDEQHAFMQDAIVARAREYDGPSLDTLSLGVIDILAVLWDFDLKNVKTLFLLSMYEFGKDRIVDELLTKSAPFISVKHFCEDGVDISCRRLNDLLNVHPTDEIRNMMGLLDADMCEWIRERAEGSEPLVHGTLKVPVGNTHLFLLRLLSLAAVAEVSKDERIKIHSLIVLSGTIVKSLEENP